MEKLYDSGVMKSKVEEDGITVLVTEQRNIEACNRKGNIVIKVRNFFFCKIFKCSVLHSRLLIDFNLLT